MVRPFLILSSKKNLYKKESLVDRYSLLTAHLIVSWQLASYGRQALLPTLQRGIDQSSVENGKAVGGVEVT